MFAHEPDAVREVLLACPLCLYVCPVLHVLLNIVFPMAQPLAGHSSVAPFPLSSGCAF